MSRVFLLLTLMFCVLVSAPCFASNTASSTLSATLVSSKDVSLTQNFANVDIDSSTGDLSNAVNSEFRVVTNNKDGVLVTFEAKSPSSNGEFKAMQGNGSNSGKVVLVNNDQRPNSMSINNALSSSPASVDNPNAIAYKITFENKNGANPVISDGIATTNVSGLSDFVIKIDNGSETSGTFDSKDISGAYTTNIVCTLTTP